MYMGVIPSSLSLVISSWCAPHVYGGDPEALEGHLLKDEVLPMYMGVIPHPAIQSTYQSCAPHVYGGDPSDAFARAWLDGCSPCIWG